MKHMRSIVAIMAAFTLFVATRSALAAGNSEAIKLPDDPTKAYITLGILVVAAVLFFTEAIPLACTAVAVPVALSLTKVVTSKTAFSFWGDPTVILFMAMFIVGEATFVTGFADRIGALAMRLSKGKPVLLLLYSMLVVGLLSGVLSNTGTTVVAVPMILGMCKRAKVAPSRILMPVAFAASLGGTLTLVGTPPNGIVKSMLDQSGIKSFGFFEFAMIGLPLFVVGMLFYALVGHRFLPQETQASTEDVVAEEKPRRENKLWISIVVFVFVVVMMATELMPLSTAAMLGALLVIATGCLTINEAYRSVDWNTIFLFAGMLSMSAAMSSSGAAAIVASGVVGLVSDPWMIMLACCGLAAVITNFMSNTATAALLAPLALTIAKATNISPLPLVMGIAMSCSCCFLTPIATPPNTIVMGPGKYRFLEYAKYGWPLQLISLILCWLLIPLIWPFHT